VADKETNTGNVRLQWSGDTVTRTLEEALFRGLTNAGIVLKRKMSDTVGVKGHPRARRSLPGEPPRVENNLLRKSMSAVPSQAERVVRVGTNQPHGRYMEFGTRTIMPRPWVQRSINDAQKGMIAAIRAAMREAVAKAVGK
jgi:hypothetical protein